ncbi:MAG: glycosyltransferase family 39 protein [Candidatus Ryanbacteria bacterium]|nr:glycosyltransferase family 39 protein [Candidatus Ryanbacteria bacterium]
MDSKKIIFAVIILSAIFLRLYALGRGDTLTDEVLISFRAVGMLDFDEAEDQTTPLEWLDPVRPWWTHLSFHDHPPLAFLAQYLSMNILGETTTGFRFPSVLAGLGTLVLTWFIGKELGGKRIGLFAAGALALTTNHVYISRIGLQESLVIFWITATLFTYLRVVRSHSISKFIYLGICLGMAFLSKYTTFLLVPIMGAHLVWSHRDILRKHWRQFLLSLGIGVLIFFPVLIYNAGLYFTYGHFDFQFSYLAGQHPPQWGVTPGKEVGTLASRIMTFIPILVSVNSPLFLLIALAGGVLMSVRWRQFLLINLAFLFYALFIIVILGPSHRFLSMLTPFFAVASGVWLAWFDEYMRGGWRRVFVLTICFASVFEVLYAYNSQIKYYPVGSPVTAYAKGARSENFNWGYNELGEYIERELEGKRPAKVFTMRYKFLEDVHEGALRRQELQRLTPYSAVVVYDYNIYNVAQLWLLDRLNIYHAWPVVSIPQYVAFMRAQGYTNPLNTGFENYYFIIATDAVPQKGLERRTNDAALFEAELRRLEVMPLPITNKRGEEVFRVYTVRPRS